jgi:hypothetical protein
MNDLTFKDIQVTAISFKDFASLKPCPFCGTTWEGAISGDRSMNKGLLVYDNAPSSDCRPWAHVVCLSCGAGQNSIRKWNARV